MPLSAPSFLGLVVLSPEVVTVVIRIEIRVKQAKRVIIQNNTQNEWKNTEQETNISKRDNKKLQKIKSRRNRTEEN